jgi:Fe-S oxidoreductase
LFRYKPGYAPLPIETQLDWSEWGGFSAAVEMCNNNGTCRKSNPGVMCPSYRATMSEQHVTRGRANALRLAVTGQLGPDAFTSDDMYAAMDLCVGCKGCKRECPTGVDMARMKIEFLHHYRKRHGLRMKDRLVAYLPRYAARVVPMAALANLRNKSRLLTHLSEKLLGLSAKRSLPAWRKDYFGSRQSDHPKNDSGREVVLLVDTFNRWFEPDNARAALRVLEAAGYRVILAHAPQGERPLCCGRTFLAAGLIEEARAEARRMLDVLEPHVARGLPVIGLEPSCLYTLKDEFLAMLPGEFTQKVAANAMLLEEFLSAEQQAGRLTLPLAALPEKRALLHGHCHQKSFDGMGAVESILKLIPELNVETVSGTCCGMAGAFGYETEHYEVSMKMAELDLLPAVRATSDDTLIVADGTSCRHQISDAT